MVPALLNAKQRQADLTSFATDTPTWIAIDKYRHLRGDTKAKLILFQGMSI